jgi:glycosyltransferase involved in cell wall biosynthesis
VVEKRKIKILHTSTIPISIRAFTLSFLKYIKGRGYDVYVARSPGKEGASIIDAGIPFFPLLMPRTIRPYNDLKAILKLHQFMRKERFDIVHTQTAKAGYVSRIAGWWAGVPIIVYTAHAFPFHAYLRPVRKRFYVFLERFASRVTDVILVDSETVRRDGIEKRIKEPEKIVTVNMGVDLQKFSPARLDRRRIREKLGIQDDQVVVGSVANFVPDKGLDSFLRIASRIKTEKDNVKFLLVGDGPLRSELESLTDALHLRQEVIFTGFTEEIPEMMSAMDVFCLATLREGFGVVFAEAMAMKVPVVTSHIDPIPEVVVQNETGILVPLKREDLFINAILSLINDDKRRREMGERGRERVEQYFDEKLMFERTLRIYEDLIRAKGLQSQ